MSFVLSVPGGMTTVLGCDNTAQLEANAQLMDKIVILTPEQMEMLHKSFYGIDPRVINPGVWFNHT